MPRNWKPNTVDWRPSVASIPLVDDTTATRCISQVGKIIRIDTKSVRAAGRATMGVKLLDLDSDDKVAAAMVIPAKSFAFPGGGKGPQAERNQR